MSSNKYSLYPRLIHWELMHSDPLGADQRQELVTGLLVIAENPKH